MKEEKKMIHQLKLNNKYFEDVICGKKTFELRQDDRDYNEGDYLTIAAYMRAAAVWSTLIIF